jgi:hypothetical protein
VTLTGSASTVLTTLSIQNTSGSTQAANYLTPMFGHPFKKGDVPTGSAPQFQISAVNQPYCWGGQTYWSDGSLKFAAFILRPTASIAGSGTASVNILNGGTAPSTSARTLAEVYAQNVVATLNPISALTDAQYGTNLSGAWTGTLAAANQHGSPQVVMDGAACKMWKVMNDFMQSGSAHGQLELNSYILALTDSSGALGGYRYLPSIEQPWMNAIAGSHTSTAINWRAFDPSNLPSFAVNGGSPTTLVWPFTAQTFTVSGGVATTTGANGYWTGSQNTSATGPGINILPVYVTNSGGALPTGLVNNRVYYIAADGNSNTITFYTNSAGGTGAGITLSTNGTGTQTVHPLPVVNPYQHLFMATDQGKYNYFQGTGSIAADSTTRIAFNNSYWNKTKVIPAYDLTQTISDTAWSGAWPKWHPVSLGVFTYDDNSGGDRPELSMIPRQGNLDHYYNQDAASELMMRTNGYVGSLLCLAFRDWATGEIQNLDASSHTGMPASTAATMSFFTSPAGWTTAGVDYPVTFNGGSASNYGEMGYGGTFDHLPDFDFYPYLATGEPQFLDLLNEEADGLLMTQGSFRNPTLTTARTGIIVAQVYGGEVRGVAWGDREVQYAAGIQPAAAAEAPYWTTIAASNNQFLADEANPSFNAWGSSTTFFTTNGLWNVKNTVGTYTLTQAWQLAYFNSVNAFAAQLNEDANALAFAQYTGTYLNWINSTFGGWEMYGYENHSAEDGTGALITSAGQFGVVCSNASGGGGACINFTWNSANSPKFQIASPQFGYTPGNGDVVVIDSAAGSKPSALSYNTPYYMRDVALSGSNYNFNVAASLVGSAITITDSGSMSTLRTFVAPASANQPAASSGNNSGGYTIIAREVMAQINIMSVAGVTGLSSVMTDAVTRNANNSSTFIPEWGFTATP